MKLIFLVTLFVSPILTIFDAESSIGLLFGFYGLAPAVTHFACLILYGVFFLLPSPSKRVFSLFKLVPLILSLFIYFYLDNLKATAILILVRSLTFSFFSAQLLRYMLYPQNVFSRNYWRKANFGVLFFLVLFFLSPLPATAVDICINWILPLLLLFTKVSLVTHSSELKALPNLGFKRLIPLAVVGALVNSFFFTYLSQVALMQKYNQLIYLIVLHLAYCLVAPRLFIKLAVIYRLALTLLPIILLVFFYSDIVRLLNYGDYSFSIFHGAYLLFLACPWFVSLWIHASNLEIHLNHEKDSVFFGVYILQYGVMVIFINILLAVSPIDPGVSVLKKAEHLIPWEKGRARRPHPDRKASSLKIFKYGLNYFRHVKVIGKRKTNEYFVYNDHFTRWTDGKYFSGRMSFLKNYISENHENVKNVLIMGLGNYKALKITLEASPNLKVTVVDNFPGYQHGEFREYILSLVGDPVDHSRYEFYNENIETYLGRTKRTFDLVYDNLTSPNFSASTRLFSYNFSKLLASRLNEEGIFIAQYTGTAVERCSYMKSFQIKDYIHREKHKEKIGIIAGPLGLKLKKEEECENLNPLNYFSYYFFKI